MKIELVRFTPEYFQPFMRWRRQNSTVAHNPLKEVESGKMFQILCEEETDLHSLSFGSKRFEEERSFRWFIQLDGNSVIGCISLKNISLMMGYAEIGYSIDEVHHNKGFATAAIGLLLQKIFSQTPLRRIIAIVHEKNFASLRVLEKLGFQKEGLLREHFILNGSPANEVYLAILRNEFLAKFPTN